MALTMFWGMPAALRALKINDLELDGNAAEKSKSRLAELEKPLEYEEIAYASISHCPECSGLW